ncbi:MAG: thiaminase II, partial [Pseudomonadota bacterium]|nr:thiaminase II [Pseudomonadota bacterium]
MDGANSLFERLKATCAKDWKRYTHHDFVAGIADGTLPEAAFRHYLIQDYLFLIQFARAYALAVYKSDKLADMRQA